eukprot:s250_g21.t1
MATWEGAERVKRIFGAADHNMDGKLSRDELRGSNMLKSIFQKVSSWDDEMIDLLLDECDYNKDGQLQDLKPRFDDFFHKHGIKNIDLNYEEEWEKALPYCQENEAFAAVSELPVWAEVDVLVVNSDAIRIAVGDDATLWQERDMWLDKRKIPEECLLRKRKLRLGASTNSGLGLFLKEKLFQIMPFVEEIIKKSKNPVIAIHPWLKEVKSQDACLDRITSQLREWRDGVKAKLKNYGDRLAQKEKFEGRVSQMEALIAESEAREAEEKDPGPHGFNGFKFFECSILFFGFREKDIAAFRPLFQQIVDVASWDEKRAAKDTWKPAAHTQETWYIEAFTEGSVEKELEKINVQMFPEEEMSVLTDFAFEHNELAKTVKSLASKTGWDLKDQQQVVHKLRRVGCVHPRALQVAVKTKNLNPRLKKHKFLPFGESSLEILEGWAAIYAARQLRDRLAESLPRGFRRNPCSRSTAMKHYRWPARAWIGWNRICRPGSILGPQQQFLCDMQQDMWQAGEALRGPVAGPKVAEIEKKMGDLSVRDRTQAERVEDVGQGERLVGAKRYGQSPTAASGTSISAASLGGRCQRGSDDSFASDGREWDRRHRRPSNTAEPLGEAGAARGGRPAARHGHYPAHSQWYLWTLR